MSWFCRDDNNNNNNNNRVKWNKEVNKVVMACFYRSEPFDEEGKYITRYRN